MQKVAERHDLKAFISRKTFKVNVLKAQQLGRYGRYGSEFVKSKQNANE
jgi:hypothetical protein